MNSRPGWRSRMTGYPPQPGPSYALSDVDLLQAVPDPDIVPPRGDAGTAWARALAMDATVYGLPGVYQYVQMYAFAVDTSSPSYVGFNAFRHDRTVAMPGYDGFKTPNVDTLYSHAWLDLSGGPVSVVVPPMGERYYTLHLLDGFSNAVNLSTRTLGPAGGHVWLATTDWRGVAPSDVLLFRVASPYMWLLMRILVRGDDDAPAVHVLQDQVALSAVTTDQKRVRWLEVPAAAESLDARRFLEVLDLCLRTNGHPTQEDALVYRFRGLGIGSGRRLEPGAWDPEVAAAVEAGHRTAFDLVRSVLRQRGAPAGPFGWRTLRSGAYGFNYLQRAATNFVGLGATVREESGAYTTFVDAEGRTLTGTRSYRLRLMPPPPVDAFWSVTAYDAETRELVANPAARYVVNDQTPGLSYGDDGSVEIVLAHHAPADSPASWLPVPESPFYLVLRAYLGHASVVEGTWAPGPVCPAW